MSPRRGDVRVHARESRKGPAKNRDRISLAQRFEIRENEARARAHTPQVAVCAVRSALPRARVAIVTGDAGVDAATMRRAALERVARVQRQYF